VKRQLARDSRDAEDAVVPSTGDLELDNTMELDILTDADVTEGFANLLSDHLEMAPSGSTGRARTSFLYMLATGPRTGSPVFAGLSM